MQALSHWPILRIFQSGLITSLLMTSSRATSSCPSKTCKEECAPYILPDLPLARPGAALQDQYRASVLGQAYIVSSFKIVWTCKSTAWTPQSGKATCRKGNKERYGKTHSHLESSWSTSGLEKLIRKRGLTSMLYPAIFQS